ncbi:MAG: Fic/DOC family protein [Methanosaeta sp. PtaU1.Bin060]|nr:MAG: Fic/DOC family protein [Methanosaeta sp. PtaU1.Bin060]
MEPYIPDNLPLNSIVWERHVPLIGRANRALARYDGVLLGIVNPQVLLSPLATHEAVLSSRIEGTQATLEDVLVYEAEMGERIEKDRRDLPRIDEIREVINYRQAMKAAVEALEHRPLNINTICDLHRILLTGVRGERKAPGEIRRIQNYIAPPGTPIERAIFVPPEPPILMDALSNWEMYLHSDEKDPLVQLAVLKAQFELIHPFLDGNGRIGRMLVPLILYSKKIISSPNFYISDYLERNRDTYHDRLLAISRDGDWNGWIDFFLQAVIEQADLNSMKARAILSLYDDMKTRIPDITGSRYSIQAIDAIFSRPIFNTREFSRISAIPRESATKILSELKDNDILEVLRQGQGRRPTTYIFASLIEITQINTMK